jgi:hypothetical protein
VITAKQVHLLLFKLPTGACRIVYALQYDIKNRKTFLKRCRYDNITADMLYIGAVVTVYSRQLKLVDYADEFTRKCLSNRQER